VFAKNGVSPEETTHLGIGAHADDLEIMAWSGISECYGKEDRWFSGVTVTNGVGSPQDPEAMLEQEELRVTRQLEQIEAAKLGEYALMAQLDYESREAKVVSDGLVEELSALIKMTAPEVVYLHQPADKHPTHIGVLKASIAALKALPEECWPERLIGCEVWRDLDWLPDDKKLYLSSGNLPELERDIIAVFQSQIRAGMDYVGGSLGRRLANGTFADPHVVKDGDSFSLGIDLMPVLREEKTLLELIQPYLEAFCADVQGQLEG